MRKIIYILVLFFGCDSLEKQFGVEEAEENFNYYDFLAYGWAKIFENDSDLSFSYFDQSLTVDGISYYNNAFVGMGWAKTYSANSILNSDLCIDSQIDCTDLVDKNRNDAKCFFYKSTLNEGNSLIGTTSSEILEECTNQTIESFDALSVMDYSITDASIYYTDACKENAQGDVEFDSCFEDYIKDLQVGYLYLEYLSYLQSITNDSIDNIQAQDIIELFNQFLLNNPDYDIMDDKSNYNFGYSFNYQNIASVISKLYLNLGDYDNSCNYADTYLDCSNLDCSTGDALDLINCINTPLN